MDQSKRRGNSVSGEGNQDLHGTSVVPFEEGHQGTCEIEDKGIFLRPTFYKMRMSEAKRIVNALRKAN